MNEIKRQIKIAKWDKVITALLAIIIGVLFIVLPDSSSDVLCAISGIVLMVAGVVAIVAFASYGFFFSGHALISGIALLLAGLFCIVNPNVVKDLLTVIFGIFIVIDGSTSIADSIECARAHVEGWVGMLILSVVTVVLGFVAADPAHVPAKVFEAYLVTTATTTSTTPMPRPTA